MKRSILLTFVMSLFVAFSVYGQSSDMGQNSSSEQANAMTSTQAAVSQTSPDSQTSVAVDADADEEFRKVDQMPEFPGGVKGIKKYLKNTLRYPLIAKENGIEGRVVCQFVVERDGSISNVEVLRSSGDMSLDREAVRLVRSMPKWAPGMQDGKPVRVRYTIPLDFKL